MEQTQRAEEIMVTCYRCGQPILLGQGRYNVLPDQSYCSFECLRQSLPHIAEAIQLFSRLNAGVGQRRFLVNRLQPS